MLKKNKKLYDFILNNQYDSDVVEILAYDYPSYPTTPTPTTPTPTTPTPQTALTLQKIGNVSISSLKIGNNSVIKIAIGNKVVYDGST